jgi:hypothetical protein
MQDYRLPTEEELSRIRKDRELLDTNRCWQEMISRMQHDAMRMISVHATTIPTDMATLWKMAMSQGKMHELKRILDLPDEVCQVKKDVKS